MVRDLVGLKRVGRNPGASAARRRAGASDIVEWHERTEAGGEPARGTESRGTSQQA